MAMLRGSVCLGLFLTLLQDAHCLYEDQVGNHDWHQSYVGAVSYVSVDQSAKSSKGVVVASETGVLAVLSPNDGSIRWRQVYEPGSSGVIDVVLRSKYGSLLTVSGGGQLLRSWDVSSGLLKYEVPTSLPPPTSSSHQMEGPGPYPYSLSQTWRPAGVHAALAGKNGGVVVVSSGAAVSGFVTRSGEKKWTYSMEVEGVVCSMYGGHNLVEVLIMGSGHELSLTKLNVSVGTIHGSLSLPAPWLSHNTTSCMRTGLGVVCLEGVALELHWATFTHPSSFHTASLLHLLPSTSTPPTLALGPSHRVDAVWLTYGGHTHWLVQLGDGRISVVSKINFGLPLVGLLDVSSAIEGGMTDVRLEGGEHGEGLEVILSYYDNEGVKNGGGVYRLTEPRGRPVLASVQLYTRSDQLLTCRVVMVMEDDSIIMFGEDGAGHGWVREDGLGTVRAVEFLDLPADQSAMVESFLDRTRAERNPLKLAFLRWKLQVQMLKEFLQKMDSADLVGNILRVDVGQQQLVRDQFNTRKMIMLVTSKGKMYGVDSNDGSIVWQLFYPWLRPFDEGRPLLLYLLRSTSHPLHPPLAVLIGRSKHPSCQHTVLLAFNPLTGTTSEREESAITCLPPLQQVSLLSKQDDTYSKILLFLTNDLEILSYPASAEVNSHLSQLQEQLFFYVVDRRLGTMDGYYVVNDEEGSPPSSLSLFHTSHLWHIHFPTHTERVLHVIPKPVYEQVSAVGRSLVDRSVQYKYLNPNLVAVVTESTDALRPGISVYLVDVVTGGVIFHTSHKAAVSPVHLVHSENWIVYQFLNSKLRRHELAVVELFEADSNKTRTAWSSLTPPQLPDVLTQAYAFPTSLVTMTTTQTKRGITTKSLLIGLKCGHVAAIPKTILDPRRAMDLTDEMKDAGLPPYSPGLGITPVLYINYNLTVMRLSHIYTTPSGLESTSLVLACGLDVYFTRVLPSKQFDLLAVDFDYTLISGVVIAMVLGTYILSKFSTRKALKLAWK